jgi:hypothetical protein
VAVRGERSNRPEAGKDAVLRVRATTTDRVQVGNPGWCRIPAGVIEELVRRGQRDAAPDKECQEEDRAKPLLERSAHGKESSLLDVAMSTADLLGS